MILKMVGFGFFGKHMNDFVITDEELRNLEKKRISPSPKSLSELIMKIKKDSMQELELGEFHENVIETKVDEYDEELFDFLSSTDNSTVDENASENATDEDPNRYVGYFRTNWNILDFCIVVTSWIEWFPISGGQNLTAIRVLRVLRPMRSVTKVPC